MKPILNPSRLATYSECLYRFYKKYVENQVPLEKLAPKREFGTLVHEAEAAHDLGEDVKKAVKRRVKEWRTSSWYNVKYSKDIALLEAECLKLHEGGSFVDGKGRATAVEGYEKWKQHNLLNGCKIVDVEKRLFVDVGPVILAPKLDLIVESDVTGEMRLWVVERKTTGRWDDVGWKWRWSLDAQTSLELIAAEASYEEEFAGIMVEPIQYTRISRKDAQELQPIGKAQRLPMKWVRKPQGVMARVMAFLEDVALELPQRLETSAFPANGMASKACDYCDFKHFCLGNDLTLYPREPDDVDLMERKKK